MNKARVKNIVLGLIVLLAVIQIIRPSRTNPAVNPARILEAHVPVPAPVQQVLQRSCYDLSLIHI